MSEMNVDVHSIVMGFLAERQLPIHFYMQALHNCLHWVNHELYTSGRINRKTVKIVLDQYGEATIPPDLVSITRIGVSKGSIVSYISQSDNINTDQSLAASASSNSDGVVYAAGCFYNYYNSHGEYVGGLYGVSTIDNQGWKLIKDRGVIKFTGFAESDELFLEYIFFDQTATAASIVPFEAVSCVTAYMNWKFFLQTGFKNRFYFQYARQEYFSELRKLRSRYSNFGIELFNKIIISSSSLSPKL